MSWLSGHLNGVILQTFTKLLVEPASSCERGISYVRFVRASRSLTVKPVLMTAAQILSNDLQAAAELLMRALMLRAQYMVWSQQKFPRVAARCLRMLIDEEFVPALIEDELLNEILRDNPATRSTSHGQPTHHTRIININIFIRTRFEVFFLFSISQRTAFLTFQSLSQLILKPFS